MPKISEAAILRRAKTLCKHDGKNWAFEFNIPPGAKVSLEFFLDEAGRREYLERARKQISSELMMPHVS